MGKKPPTATKVARKTQPSAAAGKASTSDPDYQPPEGPPEGDSDEESVSDTEDVINPLIDQELCIYDCYAMDIADAQYNTKTGIKTCPTKNQCYCGQQFGSPQEFKTHEKQHASRVWTCFECNKESKGNDKCSVYKHYRTQHERRHLHQCTFDTCSIDGHPHGNDEQYTVRWHMQQDHGLWSPLGCPKCNGTFCSKQTKQKHIPTCPTKKISLAQNKPLMLIKHSNVMSAQIKILHRLHYSSTRRCIEVLTRSMSAACVVKLWAQQ